MRYLVEVTSIGKPDKVALVVEADTWQRALQKARAMRNETGPMSGFSIELLEEGCRAVDPMSRLRYEVKRAADDLPLTDAAAPAAGAASAPAAVAPGPTSASALRVPRPVSDPTPPPAKRPLAKTAMLGSSGAAVVQREAAQPSAWSPAAAAPTSAPTPAPSPERPPPPPPSVASQIIFRREQDATPSIPLTYREYVYAVALGTDETSAEGLLLAHLGAIQSALAQHEQGKLVHLAVFDVLFQGKPPVLPLATLMWKDWRGTPAITFPRRGQPETKGPVSRPSMRPAAPPLFIAPPTPMPAPAIPRDFVPIPVPEPSVAAPPPPPAPAPQAYFPPPAQHAAPPIQPTPIQQVPPSVAPPAPSAEGTSPSYVAHDPWLPVAPLASSPQPAPAYVPPAAPLPMPIARHELTATIQDAASAVPRRASVPAISTGASGARVRGDELIADLFEAMHDLHFVRDAVEGGDFCLTLAAAKLPSRIGIVHLYDIDKREFVVTSVHGAGAETLLLRRHPESDPLLMAAMRKRRALVFPNANDSDAKTLDRFGPVGGARSIMVSPVMQLGRFLGALELIDPLDGAPFTDDDGNALTYIGEQFGEFVASRGVVTDPERVSMAGKARR